MFCKNCGKKIINDGNICLDCQSVKQPSTKIKEGLFASLFKGRIGRLKYLTRVFIVLVIFSVLASLPVAILKEIYGQAFALSIAIFLFTLIIIPIEIKRLNDLNLPAYLVLLTFAGYLHDKLSLLGMLLGLILIFKKGTDINNPHGETSAILTKWEKVSLMLIGIAVFLLFLLALPFFY